jgi:Uma2 family endonuclease
MSTKTLLTADELEQMPDDDSVQTELDEGELITMPPAGGDHGYIGWGISSELGYFVKKHKLGRLYIADTGFRLGRDTVRAPDVAFVRKERIQAIHSQGFMKGAPDLAVEVFSPTGSSRQLKRKVKQYLAAGSHTVWIFYPKRKQVDVYEASGVIRTVSGNEMLEAPELLPGFSVKVAELFEL